MSSVPQRLVGLLGLLALLPVAAYALDRGVPFVALSGVSVAVIVGSLSLLFGPAAGGDHASA